MLHMPQGAGTQHPIHFSCAPARSHTDDNKNSKQLPVTSAGEERREGEDRNKEGHTAAVVGRLLSPYQSTLPASTQPSPVQHAMVHMTTSDDSRKKKNGRPAVHRY